MLLGAPIPQQWRIQETMLMLLPMLALAQAQVLLPEQMQIQERA